MIEKEERIQEGDGSKVGLPKTENKLQKSGRGKIALVKREEER